MGTRADAVIHYGNKRSKRICCLHTNYDGGPDDFGAKLKKFVSLFRIVNGISVSHRSRYIEANGMSGLAAQIVQHCNSGPGGIYLEAANEAGADASYIYHIYQKGDKAVVELE